MSAVHLYNTIFRNMLFYRIEVKFLDIYLHLSFFTYRYLVCYFFKVPLPMDHLIKCAIQIFERLRFAFPVVHYVYRTPTLRELYIIIAVVHVFKK